MSALVGAAVARNIASAAQLALPAAIAVKVSISSTGPRKEVARRATNDRRIAGFKVPAVDSLLKEPRPTEAQPHRARDDRHQQPEVEVAVLPADLGHHVEIHAVDATDERQW